MGTYSLLFLSILWAGASREFFPPRLPRSPAGRFEIQLHDPGGPYETGSGSTSVSPLGHSPTLCPTSQASGCCRLHEPRVARLDCRRRTVRPTTHEGSQRAISSASSESSARYK